MPELVPVIRKSEIDAGVEAVAKTISADYQGCELVVIGILKGCFVFLADLIRKLTIPVQVDFIRAASYGAGTVSSGKINLSYRHEIDVRGKPVLIVEDIVDSGRTLSRIIECLHSCGAQSVAVCALIDKRERRETDVRIDYACHVVNEGFLVGCGLDYAENYRELPEIYHLNLS